MKSTLRDMASLVPVMVCAITIGALVAQTNGQQAVEPSPLEASDPRAKQAAAIVRLILDGDQEGTLKVLRSQGTPAVAQNAELTTVVKAQIDRLANKGYTIAEFMNGRGADVIVQLQSSTAENTNIVIRFTTDAPHRFEGFARAMMAGSGGTAW